MGGLGWSSTILSFVSIVLQRGLTGGTIILQEGESLRKSFESGGSILLTSLVKVGMEK